MSPFSGGLVVSGEVLETFADDFNRGNSGTVGNDWNDLGGDPGGPWEINANRVMRNDAGASVNNQNAIYRDGNIVDQYAECIPLDHGVGPIVRLAGPPGGYIAFADATKVYLEKSTPGGYSALDEHATALDFATDVLRIVALDTRISVEVNGVEIIVVADSTWLQGHRGIAVSSATGDLRADNFACGE